MKTNYSPASRILKTITIILLSGIFFSASFAQQNKKAPNILIIFSDDHAYQTISAYGSTLMQTPNIDRIAKEGAIFKKVFVTNSLCAPSRATLLTGKYGHINGLTINKVYNPFNTQQPLFPRILQQHNYQTAWIGKWHLQTLPDGFDFWKVLPDQGQYYNPQFITMNKDTVATEGYVTDVISGFAEDWINNRDTSKPFCLVVGEKATHREWLPDLQDLGAFDNRTFPVPPNFYDKYENRRAAKNQDMTIDKTMRLKEDLKVHADYEKNGIYNRFTAAQKEKFYNYYENTVSKEFDAKQYTGAALLKWKYQRYMKDYLATAKSLDRNIGRLLDYLDKNKLAENTLVIYASDQGFYMGEHGWFDKRFMYEESARTPMVMRYPGLVYPGTVVNDMIVNIDFAPTLLDAAGVQVPDDMQGKSFLPLFNHDQGAYKWRKAMYYHYYEYPEPHKVAPHFGIRTERYKLIRFYGPADYWELYDLETDPHEMKNIYTVKGKEQLSADLKKQLKDLIMQYKDEAALGIMEKKIN
ncbi:MAG: sulfatase [Chitinophagaceae bacterium]